MIIIFVIIVSIILTIALIPTIERMQCEENGWSWHDGHSPRCIIKIEECMQLGGIIEECRPSAGLSCETVCHLG